MRLVLVEGWATYAEGWAAEPGLYSSAFDPALNFKVDRWIAAHRQAIAPRYPTFRAIKALNDEVPRSGDP
jgi:hypothetical protein